MFDAKSNQLIEAVFSGKRLLLMGIVLLCLSIPSVFAEEISVIELKDGSVITGEVVSFDGKVWIIQSGSMGTLKIEGAKVVSIRTRDAFKKESSGAVSGESTSGKADIKAMQQSIMSNEKIMAMIMNLHDDPDVQAILQDPEIMRAVNAGDVNALMTNPKFIRLMENTQVKAITKEAVK